MQQWHLYGIHCVPSGELRLARILTLGFITIPTELMGNPPR